MVVGDLPEALPVDRVADQMQVNGLPRIPAAAIQGAGVQTTLKTILQGVMQSISRQIA